MIPAGASVVPGGGLWKGGEAPMLYYANGGPGPATKLLAVDDQGEGWWSAPAWSWNVSSGWHPNIHAQLDIRCLGEFFPIDEDEVIEVQHQMLLRYMVFH